MWRTRVFVCASLFFSAFQYSGQSSLHQFTGIGINKELINFSKFQGKKILLVNTASYCAYTPQYTDLESLYNQYKQYGFEIVGFPCNDFGSQEPGKDSVINNFCTGNYGVTFQMMGKISIAAGDTAPIYKWLQRKSLNGVSNAKVDWNFNKFLIDECGHWVAHYTSAIVPTSTLITSWITSQGCSVSGLEKTEKENYLLIPPASPATGQLEFKINSAIAATAELELMSIYGQTCAADLKSFVNETGYVSYDISKLGGGIYILKVSNANHVQVYKFLVNP